MEGVDGKESKVPSVVKVAKEPAIIINGVPDLPPDCTAGSEPEVKKDGESQVDPRFGEWLEGRKVKKLFGDTYYVGKVARYDSESNWYNIIYDDGDQEDLEWSELEAVLLPLDITVPLKTLVIDKYKLQQSVSSRPKVGRPKKVYATMDNQMLITGVEGQGQQSNNDATSGQLVTFIAGGNAQACLQASNQPRKRGRPRKDRSLSANNEPKKRGRPPKNRNASGNSQSAENSSDYLALVPVQDSAQESSRRQNSTLVRNTSTIRAEKLKRENLRFQGTPSGIR
ncbi:hypothetical protein HU200_004814 [Digitaria exilis]|uniref:PTM/DIR17-like Tudor domain-containing protein n=1 Tax=Digitaria exilis TaxID=1010633 RepID=A0A835KTB5_9POAL|nr:hypothetical protein HU200_004814 [Digitaria exilis]